MEQIASGNGGAPIRVIRSGRKTLSLTVTGAGEVLVRAPYRASEESIRRFVGKHAAWIADRLKERAACPRLDLSDGAELRLFGRPYRIVAGTRAAIGSGTVCLPREGREEALKDLLKRFSLEVMRISTERIARAYGFRYSRVRISSARGRWGSCNRDGVIAYTFRIAFLPPELCEYIVIHELAHTVEMNHGPAFRAILDAALPDWKTRRKALKTCHAIEYL